MSTTRSDYDSPWKDVLEWYFEPFLDLCFPRIHTAIDWSRSYEFLDKELQQIVRDAETGKRFADKLVKVWLTRGEEVWLLIHVEVQGKQEAGFAERMYVYNHRISDRYDRPVVSLAILCDGNARWRPAQFHQQILGCEILFQFPILKLLDYRQQLDGLEQSQNPFATVILAHLKAQDTRKNSHDRKTWKFSLTRRLYERGFQRQDILNLFHFIDWVMVLPKGLEQSFRQELKEYEEERSMRYVTSIERLAKQEGRQEQASRMLMQILQRRFDRVPEALQAQLEQLSIEQLENLMNDALTVESPEAFVTQVQAL